MKDAQSTNTGIPLPPECAEIVAALEEELRKTQRVLKQIALGNPAWMAGSEAIPLARAALAPEPHPLSAALWVIDHALAPEPGEGKSGEGAC